METNRRKFKINIFGQLGVGKTTLFTKLAMNDSEPVRTLGGSILKRDLQIDGKLMQFIIWDKARYEVFNPLKFLYSKTDGGIFLYDITNKSSLNDINNWIKKFREASEGINKEVPILLLGNKFDLKDRREVHTKNALELVKKYNFLDFFEISAKTGKNIEKAFLIMAREVALINKKVL